MMTRLSTGFVQPSGLRGESSISWSMSPSESDSDLVAREGFLGFNCGAFLPSQQAVEARAPLAITVRWAAAEPGRALQGPTAPPGVGHGAWSAQRASTAPLPPPTTRIVLKVGLAAPPRGVLLPLSSFHTTDVMYLSEQ